MSTTAAQSIGAPPSQGYRVYGYRWVVLAAVMFVNLTIQMLWIAFAPITSLAAKYYSVSDLWIGLLAMTFMIAFIPLSLPAAWVIDTRWRMLPWLKVSPDAARPRQRISHPT